MSGRKRRTHLQKGSEAVWDSRAKHGFGLAKKHGTLDWTLPKQYTMSEDKELTPEQRIKQLEAVLKDEQDRNLIYKTMFNILEKEHGIALPKKSLPKQSKGSRPKKK